MMMNNQIEYRLRKAGTNEYLQEFIAGDNAKLKVSTALLDDTICIQFQTLTEAIEIAKVLSGKYAQHPCDWEVVMFKRPVIYATAFPQLISVVWTTYD